MRYSTAYEAVEPMRDTAPGERLQPVYELKHTPEGDVPAQTGTIDVQQKYDSANTAMSPKDLIRNSVALGIDTSLQYGEDIDLTMIPDDPMVLRDLSAQRKQLDDLFASQPIEVRRACNFDVLQFVDLIDKMRGGTSDAPANASAENKD